jgi:hypothetical protein
MSNCENCKQLAQLIHALLPAVWRDHARMAHLLSDEEEKQLSNSITLLEQKVMEINRDQRV